MVIRSSWTPRWPAGPRAAVRRGAGRRRPGPARRQPGRRSRGSAPADARDGTVMTIERITLTGGPAGRAGPRPGHAEHPRRYSQAASPACGEQTVHDPEGSASPVPPDPSGSWPTAGPSWPEAGTYWPRLPDLAEVYAALVTGTADYVRKNGFRSVIGLSGGIDSALTATIAADAVGVDLVHVAPMPSRTSSGHSVSDAEDLAERQAHASTPPIAAMVDAFESEPCLPGREQQLQATGARSRCRCPATTAICVHLTATRARSRPATPRSTATRPAASRRSRTCSRRWSGT